MAFKPADRLKELSLKYFNEAEQTTSTGFGTIDTIDLRSGIPDRCTSDHIIQALEIAARKPENHRLQNQDYSLPFLEEISEWHLQRYGVILDPRYNILPLMGSKEGLAHFPLSFINPGDLILIPEPSYPVYLTSSILAGARFKFIHMDEKSGYLPDLETIDKRDLEEAKLIWINYPNNPTGATASRKFFQELVFLARKNNIAIVSDSVYSDLGNPKEPNPSLLQVPGALDIAIEFHSLSMTYNMSGWRIGWAAGNADLIAHLKQLKNCLDSGTFQAIQAAGLAALTGDQSPVLEQHLIYQARRNIFCQALNSIGLKPFAANSTFYVWTKIPQNYSSAEFTAKLREQVGILASPGDLFGPSGEGYVRFALTVEMDKIKLAADRLASITL